MSPLRYGGIVSTYPDTTQVEFVDDFIGSSYDNQVWGTIGNTTVTQQDANSGRILVRAPVGGGDCQFCTGNMAAFSIANGFTVEWRCKMIPPASGGGSAECGLQGAGGPVVELV